MKYLTLLLFAALFFACNAEDGDITTLTVPSELTLSETLYGNDLATKTSLDISQLAETSGVMLRKYQEIGEESAANYETPSFGYPVNENQRKALEKFAAGQLSSAFNYEMPVAEIAFPVQDLRQKEEVIYFAELKEQMSAFADPEEQVFYETLLLNLESSEALQEIIHAQLSRITTEKAKLGQGAIDRIVAVSIVISEALTEDKASCARRAVKAAAAGAVIGAVRGAYTGCVAGAVAGGVGCGPGAVTGAVAGAATGAAWGFVSGWVACIIFD